MNFDSLPVYFVEFSRGKHFITVPMHFSKPVFTIQGVGRQISANKVHVSEVGGSCSIDPESNLVIFQFIDDDLFFIDLRGKHSKDEIVHGLILFSLLEGFQEVQCAYKKVCLDEIVPDLNINLLQTDFFTIYC